MKTLLILTTAILFALSVNGQTFIYIEPMHFQIGAGYHQQMTPMYGMYAKMRKGNIEYDAFYADQLKPAVGLSINPWANSRNPEVNKNGTFLIGINYSRFYNVLDDNPAININKIKKVSVDVGFLVHVKNTKVHIYVTSDIPNWETEIGFGYKF